jgi:hypothetical protein
LGVLFGFLAVLEDGQAEVSRTGFLGIYTTNHLSPVLKGLLGLEGALVAGDALADNLGVFVDPDVRLGRSHAEAFEES